MKNKSKKNVVLADCSPEEVSNLIRGLNSHTNFEFECVSEKVCEARKGKMAELKRYFVYFVAAWHAFKKREKYNIVIGWQQFYALIFSFYCNVFHVKKKNTVVALNFTYKKKTGIIGYIYAKFMAKCVSVKYLDYIHVLSNEYAEMVSEIFAFPKNRIIVTPFGVDDVYDKWKNVNVPNGVEKKKYAMTIGRSNRDFDFLVEIWSKVDFPLLIISDTYQPRRSLPSNVKLIDNVSGDEQYPYIANCKLMIIPIEDGRICSGDTVLLTGFSFKCTIVVTKPSTLGEMYIKDGINGYLVEKKEDDMVLLIENILNDKIPDVGEKARKNFLDNFSRFSMGCRISQYLEKH